MQETAGSSAAASAVQMSDAQLNKLLASSPAELAAFEAEDAKRRAWEESAGLAAGAGAAEELAGGGCGPGCRRVA